MKVNFKNAIMAVAAITLGLTSCSNDKDEVTGEAVNVSVKISGAIKPATKAVEAPGSTDEGTIQLTNGHIFVLDVQGTVTYDEELIVAEATGEGQTLGQEVSTSSRIFVIGNIPSDDLDDITSLTSLSAINAATSLMTTQTDYTTVALANVGNVPAELAITGTTATAEVSINPLISRMELTKVVGSGDIVSFDVTGVYVDDYYPSFTYGGLYSGEIHSQGTSVDFASVLGDAGTWASSTLVAAPASGNVWAHNLAAGGLQRFIIKLENIVWNPGLGAGEPTAETPLNGTYYLTVTGYNTGGLDAFERGKIYRIGGENGIVFNEDNLGLTPNPTDISLTVNVKIVEWVLVSPTADL